MLDAALCFRLLQFTGKQKSPSSPTETKDFAVPLCLRQNSRQLNRAQHDARTRVTSGQYVCAYLVRHSGFGASFTEYCLPPFTNMAALCEAGFQLLFSITAFILNIIMLGQACCQLFLVISSFLSKSLIYDFHST